MKLRTIEEAVAAIRAKIDADHAAEARREARMVKRRGLHTCSTWTTRQDPACARCMQILAVKKKLSAQLAEDLDDN